MGLPHPINGSRLRQNSLRNQQLRRECFSIAVTPRQTVQLLQRPEVASLVGCGKGDVTE
jgi:hypothetical protein